MTAISPEGLQKIFDAVDTNDSGRISAEELYTAFNGQGETMASMAVCQVLINLYDDQGKGSIDREGFVSLYELFVSWIGIFNSFDKDGSGWIEKRELTVALKDLFPHDGDKFNQEYVDMLIAKFGEHKEGALNHEEFIFACAFAKEN